LPEAAPSGYRELIIARDGVEKSRSMVDPDGNRVCLVPPGHDGVAQLAIRMGVRSLDQHRKFYGDILGFAEQRWPGGTAFRLGDSLVTLEQDSAATVGPPREAPGWRYITLQIVDIDAVHNDLRSKGRARGPCTDHAWKRGADIDDPRSGRQLDRTIAPGLDRWQRLVKGASKTRSPVNYQLSPKGRNSTLNDHALRC
jgi:catechol 2,3-dioxygenase-like lactoylglutathione lyase family enzyme